ncbi:rsmF [Symbiodinium natans]|uniref:RsmF protein n=1 Tax=Symbiodinium natans TaxID=878477 RepID=A0A812PZ51_9DINO|nr:rsmF [Symbiodinium natans]
MTPRRRALPAACGIAILAASVWCASPGFALPKAQVEVPASFTAQFAGALPENFSWEAFREASQRPLRPCVRLNPLKGGDVRSVRCLGAANTWRLADPVPWAADGYWVQPLKPSVFSVSDQKEEELPSAWAQLAAKKAPKKGSRRSTVQASSTVRPSAPSAVSWSKDAAALLGRVYVQEASSLLPVSALRDAVGATPPASFRVLDLSAAPGGKTTALAAWLAPSSGAVVANEPNVDRCKALVENLLRTGSMPWAAVTQMDGRSCGKAWPEAFDAVLLDAPCSGESLTRRGEDLTAALDQSPAYIAKLSKLQRQLITSAFQALRVGGVLVYSTCTLNVQENEEVCRFLEESFPEAIERLPLDDLAGTESMQTVDGSLRCWPQLSDTQGFFVARFRKTAPQSSEAAPGDSKVLEPLSIREALAVKRAFLNAFGACPGLEGSSLRRRNKEVWLIPEALQDLPFSGPRRVGIRMASTRRHDLSYPAHMEWVLSFGHHLPEDSLGVAEVSKASALAFCAGEVSGDAEHHRSFLWARLLANSGTLDLANEGIQDKEKDKKKKEALKRLKDEVAQLTQEKTALSQEVQSNARDASAKAKQIAELSAQVSQQQATIASLRAEVAQKQPGAAAESAELEAKRVQKLAAEASRQQQEIASLTSQLSAVKIKYEAMQQEYSDPSLRYFLASKATKVYGDPGIQGAANKTFKYVLPHIAEALKTGTEVYAALNDTLLDSMHSILGSDTSLEPMLPTMSAFLVYGMICCPIGLMLSYALEWVCKLRELLLATSFYLFCIAALAVGFVAVTQRDPLKELYQHYSSVFVLQQSGFFGILVAQLLLIAIALCSAASADDVPVEVWLMRLCQTCFMFYFGFVYYRLVWTPTMLDEAPKTEFFGSMIGMDISSKMLPYSLSASGFALNLALEWRVQGLLEEDNQAEKEEKDVEPLWTKASAVAVENTQAVVKYNDLVLGLARWKGAMLRNDVPTQWRCPNIAL